MWQSVDALVGPAVRARLVLLANHVISREAAAMSRLRPHAGARVRIELTDIPPLLPAWPPLGLAVTPAGLFELDDTPPDAPSDLTLRFAMPDPGRLLAMLSGDVRPDVRLEGDAALAASMNWLVENLRWDLESDIAGMIGPSAAHLLANAGRGVVAALRQAIPVPDPPSR